MSETIWDTFLPGESCAQCGCIPFEGEAAKPWLRSKVCVSCHTTLDGEFDAPSSSLLTEEET